MFTKMPSTFKPWNAIRRWKELKLKYNYHFKLIGNLINELVFGFLFSLQVSNLVAKLLNIEHDLN